MKIWVNSGTDKMLLPDGNNILPEQLSINSVGSCCIHLQATTMSINVITTTHLKIQNHTFNTFRPRQNGRHFADDTFKRFFLNENVWILIKIALKFVRKDQINNIPPLVKIMAWRRPGDKPLSELMMVRIPTHICVSRLQWVKTNHLLRANMLTDAFGIVGI